MIEDRAHESSQDTDLLRGLKLFLDGLLLGIVAGAGAMLLLAPQSGKETRKRIQRKIREFRQPMEKTAKRNTEQSQQAAQAEMDWADDGGRIVPAIVDSQVQPRE